MTPLTAVKIKVSVFNDADAGTSYTSYTLPNTPFYFKPVWYNDALKYNYSQYRIIWDFGDGTTTVGPSASHFYKFPGTYTIKATLYDSTGETLDVYSSTDSVSGDTLTTLTAVNAFPDKLVFQPLTDQEREEEIYLLPAGKQSKPLEIYRYNSWQNNDWLSKNNYSIMLYASGSRSDFLSLSSYYANKWSHLRTYFGFVENIIENNQIVNTRLVESTTTTSVSVFATKKRKDTSWDIDLDFDNKKLNDTSVFCGTSGSVNSETKSLHFVDQKTSGPNYTDVVFLYASFNTEAFADYFNINRDLYKGYSLPSYGYINFKSEIQFLKTIFNPAATLAITSNGITAEGTKQTLGTLSGEFLHSFNINPIKWTGMQIPFAVTFKDINNFTTKCYPPIANFNNNSIQPNSLNVFLMQSVIPAQYNISSPVSSVKLSKAKISVNAEAPLYENSGSYFCGTVSYPDRVESVFLSAYAAIQDEIPFSVGFNYGFAGQPGLKTINRFRKRSFYSHCNAVEMDYYIDGETSTFNTSASASVSVSVAPLKAFGTQDADKVWITDSDSDKVYVYSTNGSILQTITLSAAKVFTSNNTQPLIQDLTGALNAASPANIAVDKFGYAWVSLYDALNVIKIDPSTYNVVASAVPPYENVPYTASTYYNMLSGFAGENALLPSAIDTDVDNNIWVSYSHPLCSFLVKYDSQGRVLIKKELDLFVSVQEIVVDKNNNVWAGGVDYRERFLNPYSRKDKLYKFDSNGTLYNNYPKTIDNIGNINIDLNQNIYVSSDYSSVTKIDSTDTATKLNIGSQIETYENFAPIGGIATDNQNYLWVLQNIDGKMYFYNLAQPDEILPDADLPNIAVVLPDGTQAFYSVMGDWTGIRWINKYVNIAPGEPRIIEGTSNLFSIYDSGPVIVKKNEDFDQASAFKSYVLQESLFDKPVLWDQFLGQIVGNADSEPESLGKAIYERIANFVSNNTDPDTCTLYALQSLFKQYGLDFTTFVTSFPPKLRRAVDLLSINKTVLYGSPNLYTSNFGLSTQGYNLGKNLGSEIPISNGTFIAGKPIVAYEKFSEKYLLIINTVVPETEGRAAVIGQPYPLSGINSNWGWNLVTASVSQSGLAIEPYYIFYEFVPYIVEKQVDSVIDFESPNTTLVATNSSYDAWVKFGGIMDRILSRSMYEGLGITS